MANRAGSYFPKGGHAATPKRFSINPLDDGVVKAPGNVIQSFKETSIMDSVTGNIQFEFHISVTFYQFNTKVFLTCISCGIP